MGQLEHPEAEWRAKLVLHYDGRNFYGWQKQRNQRSVQGELESLLGRLCGTAPVVTGAGRTDRGVHATGQVASALIPGRFEEKELVRALNALAPADLWIASAGPVPLDFHPVLDAVSRTYLYRLGVCPRSSSPLNAPWCWPLGRQPELKAIREATGAIVGAHDFSAFAKAGQEKRGFRCDVTAASWRASRGMVDAELLLFEITADRFLHHMVRYLVGTLVEIGLGRRPVSEMARMLADGPVCKAGPPAPPEGLFLTQVDYSSRYEES